MLHESKIVYCQQNYIHLQQRYDIYNYYRWYLVFLSPPPPPQTERTADIIKMVYCCESLKRLLKLLGIGKKVEKFLEAKGQFSIYACAKLKVRILLEGKEYMNNSQIHVSLRSSKIACFSPLLRRREEKGAIFKLRKKHGLESCSNISFPLELVHFSQAKKY